MSPQYFGRLAAGVAVVFAATALVDAADQAQSQASSSAGEKVTVVGCVTRESDFRKMHDAGRGGVAGSGIGVGNEFVLTSATMSGAASSSDRSQPGASSGASSAASAAASAAAGAGVAYELSGKGEGDAAQHVGRRVEVTGTLKPAETAGGSPTGGPSAGAPPSGVDVMSKDLKLREIDVESIREVGSTCPAM